MCRCCRKPLRGIGLIGAGAGTTAAWLREYYPGARTIALEGNPAVEQELRANVDEAHIVNLNEALPDIGTPDLILFYAPEHLSDPWSVLARLTSRIADHATVIVSVPNIAHLSVSVPLILRSRFVYQPAGILDRTHLRFFDRSSAVALLNSAGLCVEKGLRLGLGGPKTRMLDIVTLGGMRDQLTKQFVLAGRRLQAGQTQGRVHWLRGP